jgi:hypothetical protein
MTTTAKHTPGPWGAHPHMDGKPDFSGNVTDCSPEFVAHTVYIGAGETLLAEVSAYRFTDGMGVGYPRVSDFAENVANARLIAAAPDLLATLESVLRLQKVEEIESYGHIEPILHNARVSIARAKGQA